jgi:probable HAF family extracellular repeat protein
MGGRRVNSNGTVSGLPDPSFTGNSGCAAYAINNNGQIAGACYDTSNNVHLVLWDNGAVTDLGIVATAGSYVPLVKAVSINGSGQMAGWVFDGGATEGFSYSNGTLTNLGSFAASAINDKGVMVGGPDIDSGGTVQDLNALLPAGSPTILDAAGINDNGQIVATATSETALLTPA